MSNLASGLQTMTSANVALAKKVLTANSAVLYGVIGEIEVSGYFPPRPFLNEFLIQGNDLCDQDSRMKPWTPFELSNDEYEEVRDWWMAQHPEAKVDMLEVSNWNDWIYRVIHELD